MEKKITDALYRARGRFARLSELHKGLAYHTHPGAKILPTFKVQLDVTQTIPSGTWTVIEWDAFEWEKNGPQFSMPGYGHQLTDGSHFGLWHYDVVVQSAALVQIYMNAEDAFSGYVYSSTAGKDGFQNLSFNVLWEGVGERVVLKFWAFPGTTLLDGRRCLFSGHYVGPVE